MGIIRRDFDEQISVDAEPEDAIAAILEGAGAIPEDSEEPEDEEPES
jgi:hypothetical protein